MNASLLFDTKAKLGEGAIWNAHENKLYWVDIEGRNFHIYDPANGANSTYHTVERVGTVVSAGRDAVLLALENGIAILDLSSRELVYKIKTDIHTDGKRFNDGKCDPFGRFWVGSLSMQDIPRDSKLYCVTPDFEMIEKMDGLTISNGIAWSADGNTMYHIDTPTGEVTRHDFDKLTGDISNRKVIIKISPEMGYPDGMTIDNEGMLWIALWDGFCIARYNPFNGQLLEKIDVPAPKVTSCAFGGDNLSRLFITTARVEMSEEELEKYPLSGSLFYADTPYHGLPAFNFNYYEAF